jgi:DNA polymerase-4
MQLYKSVSQQIFAIFHDITPLVQGLSLDEAFLDVTASQSLLGDAPLIARLIKDRIRSQTNLTASVGVAPNKLVAKIASELEKPDGLTVVPPTLVHQVLDSLSVRRLPGLGRKTGIRVENAGIRTLGELRKASDAKLWPIFGKYTSRIRERAAGIDNRPVDPERDEKSISAEDTFHNDISDPKVLQAQLAALADRASARARNKGLTTGCVSVKIRQQDFATFTRQRIVTPATDDGRVIARVAAELLSKWLALHRGSKLRLLGVALSDLSPATQLGLFEAAQSSDQARRIDVVVDEVHERFGPGALRRASSIK